MIETSAVSSAASSRQFIRLCLRGRWDSDALLAAREVLAYTPMDWEQFLKVGRAEGVLPLLYSLLKGREILPPDVEEKLRQAYRRNRGRNIFLFDEVKCLLQDLAAANVSVILLKGAVLANTIYSDFGVRPLNDVDLLVQRKDVKIALRQMMALGYSSAREELQTGATLAYENEMMLYKTGPVPTPIELHWSLFDSPYYQHALSMDWFWQTSQPLDFFGAQTRMLGPEAQLLHLSGHIILHHEGTELLWLHDIAEVLIQYQELIDWQQVLTQAQLHDLVLPLQRALKIVQDHWQAPVPDTVWQELLGLQASPAEERLVNIMTATDRAVGHRFLDDLTSLPNWGERVRFAVDSLFPSPAYMQARYHITNPFLVVFYYPYRWYRGLRSMF